MMKSFQLHEDDGESAAMAKTDELHKFLEPLCGPKTPHDFEGSNSGLSVYLTINVGDTMLMRGDGSFRVLVKDEPVGITRHSFPMTHMAMLLVEYDNGAHHVNRIAATLGDEKAKVNLETFYMPYAYGVDKLVTAENALHQLMIHAKIEGFEQFTTGEQGETESLIRALDSVIPDLPVAHALMNDWFNAWEDDKEAAAS